MLNRTPLFSAHQRLGGRLIDFGGWEMPVQYTGIVAEHLAVRQAAGLFDISHMGEILLRGAAAEDFLNRTLTNDVRRLADGQGQYTLMCNERGGAIDDLYAYRLGPAEYLLIINASRIEPDVAWLEKQVGAFARRTEMELLNQSEALGAVAVQGPRTADFITTCFPGVSSAGTRVSAATDLARNRIAQFQFAGQNIWISRTGYTGEDGFEIVAPATLLESIWNRVLETGADSGLQPAGLGARDTLRTEVCYPLYGHELDETTSPIEAGLGRFVSFEKGPFVGREVLARQKADGVSRRLIAFKMTGKSAPPRPQYRIWANGECVGQVVSGTQSPSLGIGIGMGYVPPGLATPETKIEIEIRATRAPAVVVSKPIYRKA